MGVHVHLNICEEGRFCGKCSYHSKIKMLRKNENSKSLVLNNEKETDKTEEENAKGKLVG